MRVLIIPDADFLSRERAMLGRLEIGLADEGVRVVHASPATSEVTEPAGVFSVSVSYADRGLPFTLPLRVSSLERALAAAIPQEFQGGSDVGSDSGRIVDLVYSAGEGSWPMAVELGKRLGAGVVIDVWCSRLAPAARALSNRVSTRSVLRGLSLRFLAPDTPMAAQLRKDIPAALVPVVPWGVHPGEITRGAIGSSGSTAIAVLVSGVDAGPVRAAIEALAKVGAGVSGLVVLVDADAAERLPIWAWARAAGLSDRLSVITDMEGKRDLVMQADILLIPEASGEHRSIVLEAMASRMLVIAARDPMVEWLADDRYAMLVDKPDPAGFSQALTGALTDPARTAMLREAAFAEIRDRRRASGQVRALLSVCEAIVADAGNRTGRGANGGARA